MKIWVKLYAFNNTSNLEFNSTLKTDKTSVLRQTLKLSVVKVYPPQKVHARKNV